MAVVAICPMTMQRRLPVSKTTLPALIRPLTVEEMGAVSGAATIPVRRVVNEPNPLPLGPMFEKR
jgi:hypothetical protein